MPLAPPPLFASALPFFSPHKSLTLQSEVPPPLASKPVGSGKLEVVKGMEKTTLKQKTLLSFDASSDEAMANRWKYTKSQTQIYEPEFHTFLPFKKNRLGWPK